MLTNGIISFEQLSPDEDNEKEKLWQKQTSL